MKYTCPCSGHNEQKNYQKFGAREEEMIPYVRPAYPDEPLDPTWGPID